MTHSSTTWRTALVRATTVLTIGVAVAGCIGGQSATTKQRSDALGDQSGAVPPSTHRETDWHEAATGHAAAGRISADELARLERRSSPGGNLEPDGGLVDAGTPDARAGR